MKKIITPNTTNTINTIMYDDQRLFTTTSDPLYSEDNESNNKFSMKSNNNTNSNNNIEKPLKYLNKKILKINIEDIKKFKKINVNNKNRKNNNKNDNKIKQLVIIIMINIKKYCKINFKLFFIG